MRRSIPVFAVLLFSMSPAMADIWTTLAKPGARDTHMQSASMAIASWASTTTSPAPTPFLYDGTTWTTLDKPGATRTLAYDISNGRIVGRYYDGANTHGFLYDGTDCRTLDAPAHT